MVDFLTCMNLGLGEALGWHWSWVLDYTGLALELDATSHC
jgi:hypothetical protein